MRSLLRTAAVLVALGVALVACGNKPVDRAGAIRQADVICRDVAERFGRLADETDPAAYYREARRINAEGAALLRGIAGPEELRNDLRILAERIDLAARLFERAATRAADGLSTAALEKAIARAGTDFVARARALGLTECGTPTPEPSPSRDR
jgi:hypothetical protein